MTPYPPDLAEIANRHLFAQEDESFRARMGEAIGELCEEAWRTMDDAERQEFILRAERSQSSTSRASPVELATPRDLIALTYLYVRVQRKLAGRPVPRLATRLLKWLQRLDDQERDQLFDLCLGDLVGLTTDDDKRWIEERIQHFCDEVQNMATEFYFDLAGLPRDFDGPAFVEAVKRGLASRTNDLDLAGPVVTGLLLLDEQYDHNAGTFNSAIGRAHEELLGTTPVDLPTQEDDVKRHFVEIIGISQGRADEIWNKIGVRAFEALRVSTRDEIVRRWKVDLTVDELELIQRNLPPTISSSRLYEQLIRALPDLPGNTDRIAFQELAQVGRFMTRELNTVAYYEPKKFVQQADIGGKGWAGGRASGGGGSSGGGTSRFGLELPPLADDPDVGIDIEPDNVRAVAMIAATYHLETLLDTGDRALELWQIGQLAIGGDAVGRKFDAYHFSSDERLSKAARFMHHGRVLGVQGGEVSFETRSNTEYSALLLKCVSNISAWGEAQQPQAFLNPNTRVSLSGHDERVRKSLRELAANASLFGYASAHFAGRRMSAHIETVLDLFNEPELQRALGVTGRWQVAERLAAMDGIQFNIVRQHRLAYSTHALLNLVAKHHRVLSRVSRRPLLSRRVDGGVVPGDIDIDDTEEFLRQAEHWLAVNGIQDADVQRASQPAESVYAPTIPSYQRAGTNGQNGGTNRIAELRERVMRGESPNIDEFRAAIMPTN